MVKRLLQTRLGVCQHRQIAPLAAKNDLMHHPPRHHCEKACQDQPKAIKRNHHLFVAFDLADFCKVNRQSKGYQCPKAEQVDRAILPPKLNFMDEERRDGNNRHDDCPYPPQGFVKARAFLHGQLYATQNHRQQCRQRVQKDRWGFGE